MRSLVEAGWGRGMGAVLEEGFGLMAWRWLLLLLMLLHIIPDHVIIIMSIFTMTTVVVVRRDIVVMGGGNGRVVDTGVGIETLPFK